MTADERSNLIDFVAREREKLNQPRHKKKTNGLAESLAVSEDAMALAFADRYESELRYVDTWGRWLRYSDNHWTFDETLLVFDLVRDLCRDTAIVSAPRSSN
jgi:hypothetical protein